MVETRWLKDFLTTAETRNFSRAAERLNSTQPALSRRIQALEDWLGARLLDRDTQPISLTREGELFLPAAEELLRGLDRARAEVRALRQASPTMVRFITTHGLATTVLPAWLPSLESIAGEFSMRLETASFDDCAAAMTTASSDFMLAYTNALIPMPLDPKAFPSVVIERDRFLPVSAPDERGRPRHPVPGIAPNQPSSYLAYTQSSGFGRLLNHWLHGREQSLNLVRFFESHLAGVLKIMACEGRGLTWLAARYVAAEVAAGRLVRAGSRDFVIDIEVRMFRHPSRMSTACENVWNAAVQLADNTMRQEHRSI
jgi:DNA-binding transcriptional LysR family regulator